MRSLGFAAALALMAAMPVAAADPAPPAPPAASPVDPADPAEQATVAAKANLPKVKVKPRLLGGMEADFPEAERQAGHFGLVVISGVLGIDGRLAFAKVARSSGAPVLDALALEAVKSASFEPARDADGAAIAIPISVPQEFYGYKTAGPGGGILRYSCREFAANMDWWRSVHPDAKWSDLELYNLMVGISVLGRGVNPATLKADLADFERRWGVAIEKCRAKPDKRFIDMLQPEGRMAEALAKAG